MTRMDVIALETLLDDRHYPRRLGKFWDDGAALLVFLRHFESAFAYEQVDILEQSKAALRVTTVLIGIGTPRDASHFRRSTGTRLPILVDPALTIYRRLGLRHATLTSIKPSDIMAWARSQHTRVSLTGGEQRGQLGGSFLINKSGKVLDEQRASRISQLTAPADIDRYLSRLAE